MDDNHILTITSEDIREIMKSIRILREAANTLELHLESLGIHNYDTTERGNYNKDTTTTGNDVWRCYD